MKILIIEDEWLTAADLKDCILALRPDFEVLEPVTSIEEGVEFFEEGIEVDLIFSDIQLSDGLSFEIFKKVDVTVPVIFCTAFNEYALKAFEANGIAYVQKPFTNQSIEDAIGRFESFANIQDNKLSKLITYLEKDDMQRTSNSIIVHQGGKIIPIDISEIAVMYHQEGKVTIITFKNRKLVASESLEELTKIVGDTFYRANRQFLVSRKAVKDAEPYYNRKMLLNLTIPLDEKIIISKEKSQPFLKWLTSH